MCISTSILNFFYFAFQASCQGYPNVGRHFEVAFYRDNNEFRRFFNISSHEMAFLFPLIDRSLKRDKYFDLIWWKLWNFDNFEVLTVFVRCTLCLNIRLDMLHCITFSMHYWSSWILHLERLKIQCFYQHHIQFKFSFANLCRFECDCRQQSKRQEMYWIVMKLGSCWMIEVHLDRIFIQWQFHPFIGN